jgi:hypothetical protein
MSKRPAGESETHQSEMAKRVRQDVEREEGEVGLEDIDSTAALKQLVGIVSFGSTKNTHVEDNSKTAAKGGRAPKQTRTARQYMNKKKKTAPPPKSHQRDSEE